MLDSMNRNGYSTSYFFLSLFATLTIIFAGYIYLEGQATNKIYDAILAEPAKTSVASVTFPDTKTVFSIPDWSYFSEGNIWSLTSRTEELPKNYKAQNIITSSVPHANDATEVSSTIEPALERLVAAATKDNVELMLSSAYRSISDQQNLYDEFVATKGKAMADLYVAKPGTSEHHTGLAIDFADVSEKCKIDSNSCNLSSESAQWLAAHAPDYGFVLRYPEGRKPTTGIAYEPWHYRYIGIPLAKAVTAADITLDEALEQMYPAFAKR